MTVTCPACLCRLDLHTDAACIAALVAAARPFVAVHRSEPNAAHDDVDVLVKVPWEAWDKLRRLVERGERGVNDG